jgi:hypothetical protein
MRRKTDTAETIQALQGEKSNLLLEAQMLAATGNADGAIERYALAAPKEERIAAYYRKQGENVQAARHLFSAAVCWAKTGNLHNAITLFDALSDSASTPGRLKVDAMLFAAHLRQQQRNILQSYSPTLQVAA